VLKSENNLLSKPPSKEPSVASRKPSEPKDVEKENSSSTLKVPIEKVFLKKQLTHIISVKSSISSLVPSKREVMVVEPSDTLMPVNSLPKLLLSTSQTPLNATVSRNGYKLGAFNTTTTGSESAKKIKLKSGTIKKTELAGDLFPPIVFKTLESQM